MEDNSNLSAEPGALNARLEDQATQSHVIPVAEEFATVSRNIVETGKVRITKKVTEEQVPFTLPLTSEQYFVERVAIGEVVDTPPAAVRHEGETTIIPVLREVMVMQKRYEIVEEIRITKQVTESNETQHATLRSEEVSISRSGSDESRKTV